MSVPGIRFPRGPAILDPDGDIVDTAQASYQGQPEPSTRVQVFHFGDPVLVLTKPGPYAVDVLVDDVPVFSFPVYVLGTSQEEADDGTH